MGAICSFKLGSAQAFDRIRSTLGRGQTKTEWEFLGKKVCVSAWKKLHALGSSAVLRTPFHGVKVAKLPLFIASCEAQEGSIA